MYHELYIAGIVTVLRRSSYGYLNKDGSIYFEVGFPLMYRLQVPVLEQQQCRVKKPQTEPILSSLSRWNQTGISGNETQSILTLFMSCIPFWERERKKKISHKTFGSLKKKRGGGIFFLWQKLYHYTNTNCSFYTSTRVFLFGFQIPKLNSSFYPVRVWRELSLWHLHIHQTSYCI